MKNQLKQVLIALTVIAVCAAAMIGGSRFITRERGFEDLLPTGPEEISRCQVQIQPADGADQSFQLTSEQIDQVLERLESGRYKNRLSNILNRLTNSITGVPVDMDPSARLTFGTDDELRLELMLCGSTLVVNTLSGSNARDGYYDTVGGIPFQQEIVLWLAELA